MSIRPPGALLALAAFIAPLSVPVAAQTTAAPPATTVAPDACTAPLAPGDYDCAMAWGGLMRTYKVHVPAGYAAARPVALLLDLHGLTIGAAEQRAKSGHLQQSEARGFIAIWPDGYDHSWNGYGCCGTALMRGVDDVGFLRALVSRIAAQASVDRERVYVSGHSNGGSMTQRLACEAADVFRAAAPVSFPLNQPWRCRPAWPITVVAYHGTADPIVAYHGLIFQGARASLADWARIDGCRGDPVRTQLSGRSRDETFASCTGGVRAGLVTIAGADHELYGNPDLDLAAHMWTNVFR